MTSTELSQRIDALIAEAKETVALIERIDALITETGSFFEKYRTIPEVPAGEPASSPALTGQPRP